MSLRESDDEEETETHTQRKRHSVVHALISTQGGGEAVNRQSSINKSMSLGRKSIDLALLRRRLHVLPRTKRPNLALHSHDKQFPLLYAMTPTRAGGAEE